MRKVTVFLLATILSVVSFKAQSVDIIFTVEGTNNTWVVPLEPSSVVNMTIDGNVEAVCDDSAPACQDLFNIFKVTINAPENATVGQPFLVSWSASEMPRLCILFSDPEDLGWEGDHPNSNDGVVIDTQSGAVFLTRNVPGPLMLGISCFIDDSMAREEKTIQVYP